jgi:PhnB protein
MADVQPIPDGYPRVIPYLTVDGASAAIEFYASVLGATERVRMPGPGDTIAHAELQLGDSVIMLSDEVPDFGNRSPRSVGGTPVIVSVYDEDVDAVFERAMNAGATVVQPVQDMFYGDRTCQFEDPWGHRWNVGTHVEDVSAEEMAKRLAEMMGGG